MESSQETERNGWVWGWIVAILVAALVVGWGLLSFFTVRDEPRTWHFGVLPDAPGQSIYSTRESPDAAGPVPTQIPALPEARPKSAPGGAT